MFIAYREIFILSTESVWTYWSYGDEAFLAQIEDLEFQAPYESTIISRELYISVPNPDHRDLYIFGQEVLKQSRELYLFSRLPNIYGELYINSQEFVRQS